MTSNSIPALECKLLTKLYGRNAAFAEFNLTAHSGKIIGLLGPAGAGKSTLFKIATCLERSTAGELLIYGNPPSTKALADIAYLPDAITINSFPNVGSLIKYYSSFYSDFRPAVAENLLNELNLHKKTAIKLLSMDARRRLQIAMTMARSAKLYLLDEPTAWLNSDSCDFFHRAVLANCPPTSTVIIASSQIADVEGVLDDFFFISFGGRIKLSGSAKVAREGSGRSLADLAKEVM